mmetsp:Transcript_9273/g.13879  ORF Transcript_9273/g.13879 Transcript_9273/m.13879 type:complete len:341 (+) Transcript_9273:80-1102(+)
MKFIFFIWCAVIVSTSTDFRIQVSAENEILFSHYQPSKTEKLWIDNVDTWEKKVCSHLPSKMIEKYLRSIEEVNSMSDLELYNYIHGGYVKFDRHLSHYHYNITNNTNGLKYSIAIPIEGIIGLARDPRKCFDVMSENYTQSKAFLLPMRGTLETYLNLNSKTKSKAETSRKNYLFDAGATYYSDTSSQGTKWIVDWYSKINLRFTNVIAWEKKPMMGDLAIKGIPDELVHGYQYFNHPISAEKFNVWNPLNFIKKKCVQDDFVVFKLDIDHKLTESAIVSQLKNDPQARMLIDDFYYEEHFRNDAMRMHGWMGYPSTLSDYYKLAIPLRMSGFRMHYWP